VVAPTPSHGTPVRPTTSPQVPAGTDAPRVRRTAVQFSGADFASRTSAGTNICDAGYHPCTGWEAMVIDITSPTALFDSQGWVVGSFAGFDPHLRSLVNGQDSTVCPEHSHVTKYPSSYTFRAITTPGGLHCAPDTENYPVWCCRNRAAP